MEQRLDIIIPTDLAGNRLDQALAALLSDRSRSFIQKLFDAGHVTLAETAVKPSRRVKADEAYAVVIPEAAPLDARPESLPIDTLYEDQDIVVVNKRPGMVVHPSQGHRGGTLVNALLHHYGDELSGIGGVIRPGIVHRLDKDTSGCLVAAKNDAAHRNLIQQFMERDVGKTYLAITDGRPRPDAGTVEGRMGRSPRDRKLHALLKSGGRHSLTRYRTLENYGLLALVECVLETGRTHQARVHLASLGSPVLCDREYGKGGVFTRRDLARVLDVYRFGEQRDAKGDDTAVLIGRQALHAWRLAFRHPADGRELSFEAPAPDDMLAVLEPLRAARREMENAR